MSTPLDALSDVIRSEPIDCGFGDVRTFSFRYCSTGGCEVEGLAAFPPEGNTARPGLVFNRGGNREFVPCTIDNIVPYAAAGYVVLASQYRGGCGGTGKDEYGGADVDDVIKLVDMLCTMDGVCRGGVYMAGRSRGGMMTYLALARDSRIRAAGIMAGLADCVSMYTTREQSMKDVFHELVGGGPDDLPEAFAARSAVRWAGRIKAPVVLCHGTADERVVFSQAIEMERALYAAGVEHRFVVYEGATHSLADTDCRQAILDWFARHPL